MPFKSKAQARFMFAKHPKIAKEFASHTKSIKSLPKYSHKNIRGKLSKAADKHFFSNYSK